MQIIKNIAGMTAYADAARSRGEGVVLVPTMGFLHAGHVKLLEAGRSEGSVLVLSIFINPAQFGLKEDFKGYPRDMERDIKIARDAGVDAVFIPDAAQMYPEGYRTYLTVEGFSERLCGISRPGHFKGVATVVLKLFNIVRPNRAIFGKKDFQQFVIIKRLAADLNLGVEITGVDTVREADGLAMSSRNIYLSPAERLSARCIPRSLEAAKEAVSSGQRQSKAIIKKVKNIIETEALAAIEYVKICDPMTLEDAPRVEQPALLAIAVRLGKTRLIDNALLS